MNSVAVIVKKMAKAAAEPIARDLLAKVGLAGFTARYPRELSGGQQQRVAIARAMAMQPEIMLFDEVTSALDPTTEAEIVANIGALRGEYTIIAITHRPAWTDIADQLYHVSRGTVSGGVPRRQSFKMRG